MGRPQRQRIKNQHAESAQFRLRALLGFAIVVLCLGGLAAWYFKLQVIDHADYAKRSEANRVKPRPVVPARGLIYDRKGRILADNVPAFRLDVVPETALGKAGDAKALIERLSKIIALTPDDIAQFERVRKAKRGFNAVTLKLRLTPEEISRFAVDQWRFPGVTVEPYLTRRYPYGDLFAHIVGYVGRTDEKDIAAFGNEHGVFTHTGRSGIERFYDEILRGKIGFEEVKTNVEGRPMGRVRRVPATAGTDLRLSVDADLQRAMVDAFGDNDGAAVAIDPKTGEILAMVSLPSYDPNLFVNGISNTDYRRLMDNPSRPLFNRNVLGGGPPGSTIKPFVALAGLESGLRTPQSQVYSTGEFHIPGQKRGYRDAHGGAGLTNLRKSIAQSVNYYYYKLAYDMGIARFDSYMRRYGFGQPTGIDMMGENDGIVPSPQWKAKRSKEPWYAGETVISGIGQGYWIATTLQLARGVAAIADNGQARRPHLARDRRDGFDKPWTPMPQPTSTPLTTHVGYVREIQGGMEGTIYDPGGTGRAMARGAPYRMAGKTGTAQKISRRGNVSLNPHSLPLHLRHQAWFVGYAPAEDPQIAIAVIVEHGGFGGSAAAPVARKVFDAWLLGKLPERDPNSIPFTAIGAEAVAAADAGRLPPKPEDAVRERARRFLPVSGAAPSSAMPAVVEPVETADAVEEDVDPAVIAPDASTAQSGATH